EEILETLKLPIEEVEAYRPAERSSELTGNGIVPVNFNISITKGGYEEQDLRTAIETDVKYVLTQFRSSREHLSEDPSLPLDYTLADKGGHYLVTVRTFGVTKYPTQIYEALSYFVIFLCLLAGWFKYKEQLPDGLYLGLFLIS